MFHSLVEIGEENESKVGAPLPSDALPLYGPISGVRDEALDRDTGQIRDPWWPIFESCARHGAPVLDKWRRDVGRLSRERGLAYRLEVWNEDPKDSGQWGLDPIPWVFSPEGWEKVEAGIAQKMRLYDALLRDLYGERRTIKEGTLPPELVFGNQGFLRSLSGTLKHESIPALGMSCFDLARTDSGDWKVLSNRFDNPFGLGVALENRTVVNQVLPNLFKRCQVRRIGPFFEYWFDHLSRLGRQYSEKPRMVILDSNLYLGKSELGFLAKYLKIHRVKASDLTVRDGAVWLKSVYGLKQIHVIWNADHGIQSDPLSVPRSPQGGGVPGLSEAIRYEQVAVLGHPGSEVVQSDGMLPFEEDLCQFLLGESVLMPTGISKWGGDPDSLKWILEKLPNMVIKEVGHHFTFENINGAHLTNDELVKLRQKILADPARFVGQQRLNISTIPLSIPGKLVPRRAVLRVFAFMDFDGNVRVMPGGVARTGMQDGKIVSTRKGGESKDVWVRSKEQQRAVSTAQIFERSKISSDVVITSRSAENLFWAGRYLERTQTITRFVLRLLDQASIEEAYPEEMVQENEAFLFNGLFEISYLTKWLRKQDLSRGKVSILLSDTTCPAGVASNLLAFYRAALRAQEEWSPRGLFVLQQAHDEWFDSLGTSAKVARLDLNLAAFVGLSLDSMTRDVRWALFELGKSIERIQWLSGLIKKLLKEEPEPPVETLLCESILLATDSLRTFQSEFSALPNVQKTLRLLLGEEDYPRALTYLFRRVHGCLKKLPEGDAREKALLLVQGLDQDISNILSQTDEALEALASEHLTTVEESLKSLSDLLTKAYFSHADPIRHE